MDLIDIYGNDMGFDKNAWSKTDLSFFGIKEMGKMSTMDFKTNEFF